MVKMMKMINSIEFSICPFIESKMWIITYIDFCDRRKGLRRLFKQLSQNEQTFYKWYVYANVHMNEKHKNAIWDYLNFDDEEYEQVLLNLKKTYKPLKG